MFEPNTVSCKKQFIFFIKSMTFNVHTCEFWRVLM